MATGTGKTHTALRIARQLIISDQVDSLIVAADGNDLLDQWYNQLTPMCSELREQFAVVRHYGSYKDRDQFVLDPQGMILLASRGNLPPALRALSLAQGRKTLLIHDEVHRLGSPGNRSDLNGLSDSIRFRLGLSATPEREYDQDGTAFIENHVGPVIYRFDLRDAIARGILSPFDYHPIQWSPNADDRAAIQQVYKRAAAREASGNPMSRNDVWIEIAKVYKTSLVKVPLFRDFIAAHQDLLRRCIIFVETKEYGGIILEIVHLHRTDFHTYFAEDESETLRRFARGELECLITCHRLSEGIDVRSLRTVILLSSARARLETIQRMGRCLRVDPTNPTKHSHIVDFIRTRSDDDPTGEPTPDEDRRDWLLELSQIQPEL
jgi:superfamily II DNA or RNA helicase